MTQVIVEPADDDEGREIELSRPYPATAKAPVILRVDPRVFELSYFERCMECTFCGDRCCAGGVGIDPADIARLEARATSLRQYTVAPPERWFEDASTVDADYPSGRFIDTLVVEGSCALRRRGGRGCGIHAFTIDLGVDYHELKPIYCCLFPVTVIEGDLMPSPEITEEQFVCSGPGASLYRGVRHELEHYFGPALIQELDRLEAGFVRPA